MRQAPDPAPHIAAPVHPGPPVYNTPGFGINAATGGITRTGEMHAPAAPPVYNTPGYGVGPTGEMVGTPGFSANAPSVQPDYSLGTYGDKGQHSIWGTQFDNNGILGQKGTSNILWSVANTGGEVYDRHGNPIKKVAHDSLVWMSPAQVMGQYAAMSRTNPKAYAEFLLELYKGGYLGSGTKIDSAWSKTAPAVQAALKDYIQTKSTGVLQPFNAPAGLKPDGGKDEHGHVTFQQTGQLGFLQSNAVANGWYPGVGGTTGNGGTYGLAGPIPGEANYPGTGGSAGGGGSGGGYSRRYYSRRGGGGSGGGGGGSAGPVTLADADSLKQVATRAAQDALGKNLTDAQLEQFVASFHALQQTDAANLADTPNASTEAVNFIKSQDSGEFKSHQVESYTDALYNLLMTNSSGPPNQAPLGTSGTN